MVDPNQSQFKENSRSLTKINLARVTQGVSRKTTDEMSDFERLMECMNPGRRGRKQQELNAHKIGGKPSEGETDQSTMG